MSAKLAYAKAIFERDSAEKELQSAVDGCLSSMAQHRAIIDRAKAKVTEKKQAEELARRTLERLTGRTELTIQEKE